MRDADQLLDDLLKYFYRTDGIRKNCGPSITWSYQEDISLEEIDAQLNMELVEYWDAHKIKSV